MAAAIAAPSRYRLRQLAERCGIRAALGGPLPPGRRIEVLVRAGAAVADRETSARWRGKVLISEQPAALAEDNRAALHDAAAHLAAAAGLADARLDFAVGDDEDALIELVADATAISADDGIHLAAGITAGEPLASAGEVVGLVTGLNLPPGATTAVALGAELRIPTGTPLATVHVSAPDRDGAVAALRTALDGVRLDGIASNLLLLRQAAASVAFAAGLDSSRDLDALAYAPAAIEVLHAGTHTTVQDVPGRLGYWHVGVPPSGPMDDCALRLANRLVGNPADAAGLELTLVGPTLRFHVTAIVCLAGPPLGATIDGEPLPAWRAVVVPGGAVLKLGAAASVGCRAALAVRHGLDVPVYLGSRSTFDLGGFGGHAGRALRVGDWLPLVRASAAAEIAECPDALPVAARPAYAREWELGVLEGPHGAPEFFTAADMAMLYATAWEVHHNSSRTGVRLNGPKPRWARRDGGEAGLHPSNIHDNAYAVGAIDFTGDMPILLGPDGPSLGGFVCPAVVVAAERWKLGQLRPGDRVHFMKLTADEALARQDEQERLIAELAAAKSSPTIVRTGSGDGAILARRDADGPRPARCLRRSGDQYLLLEYGEPVLDIGLRLRVHLLQEEFARRHPAGVIDVTPGIRSLQVHHDPRQLSQGRLVDLLCAIDDGLPPIDDVAVPTRTVHLPLSWDDPATRLAIERYMRTVRADAPWCPSNLEFIRRINGLSTVEQVREIVHAADYLVLGLGDVYLGAPVATPLDPRHRLVTTKYNPARTWTPQNAVGIGGAYMCVYGMEGPGGYQFVGRTVPVWNSWGTWAHERKASAAGDRQRWLLRCFDRIRFHAVSAAELLDLRRDLLAGTAELKVEESRFVWRDYQCFLAEHDAAIHAFRDRQRRPFSAERARWEFTSSAAEGAPGGVWGAQPPAAKAKQPGGAYNGTSGSSGAGL